MCKIVYNKKITMKTNWFAILLVAGSIIFPVAKTFAAMPKTGDTAPSFEGTNQNGKDFKLADLVGKKIVLLYFYPKDFTGGCTKEACSFRDGFEEFTANNVEIVGVSFDSADSHLQFIAKYKLNFTLLADTNGKIADVYGVRKKHGSARQFSHRSRRKNRPHHRYGQS